jgi:hypothetical protein
VRLAFAVACAVLVVVAGGGVYELATRVGDRTGRRITAAMIAIGVSPLALYPWAPAWYGPAAGYLVGVIGVGYAALAPIWRWRGRSTKGE